MKACWNPLVRKYVIFYRFKFNIFDTLAYFHVPELWNNFADKLEHVLPIIFGYNHLKSSVQETMTKQIIQFYFKNYLSRDKELNVTNVTTGQIVST